MTFNKRLFISFVLLFASLILRETPYASIFIINNLFAIYLLILFFLFLPIVVKVISRWAVVLLPLMLLTAVILSLTGLTRLTEIIGILLYFSLWIVILYKIYRFVKSS